MPTAAELIAKVSVQGVPHATGQLYKMGSAVQDASAKANIGRQMFAGLGTTLQSASSVAMPAVSAMFRAIEVGATAMLGALSVAGIGFLKFTTDAVQEAAKIQRIQLTFQALSGSVDGAAAKMAFLNKFAQQSIGQFDDLAAAGTILEASGLNMERFLPSISNIAGAFGGATVQVQELTSAVSRLTSGQFGESMEIFRRFGMGVGDFKAQGIKFDNGGRALATAEQMLSAVEAIATRKFGKIGDVMGDSMVVKMSNLQDAWNQMLAKFGEGWFPFIEKIVSSIQPMISFFTDSGEIAKIAQNFAGLFGAVDTGGIQRIVAYLAATMEQLPNIFRNAMDFGKDFLSLAYKVGANIVNTVVQAIGDAIVAFKSMLPTLNKITDIILRLNEILHITSGATGLANPGQSISNPFAGMKVPNMEDLFKQLPYAGGIFSGISGRTDEIMKQFEESQKNKKADPIDPKKFGMFNSSYNPLSDIAENTKQTAQNTATMADLKRFALGGGELGAMGITAAERYGRGSGARGALSININTGGGGVEKALAEAFMEWLQQAHSQNAFTGLSGG